MQRLQDDNYCANFVCTFKDVNLSGNLHNHISLNFKI